MQSKEDFDSQVQMVVERLYEDEAFRADLTDDEAQPLLDWASQELMTRLDKFYSQAKTDAELQAAPDNEYSRVKNLAQDIISFSAPGKSGAKVSPDVSKELQQAGIAPGTLAQLQKEKARKSRADIINALVQALQAKPAVAGQTQPAQKP